MTRHIAIGNGQLLVNLDSNSYIRDIYYPYVGQYNHVGGQLCRFGIWIDGQFSWLDNPAWHKESRYADSTLVAITEAVHSSLGIRLVIYDGVHQREPILLRTVEVFNEWDNEREVRLFFHQDLSIGESEVGDTAAFLPENGSLFHYKRNFYFMFNGWSDSGGIAQYSIGIKRFGGAQGTWVDAEDGHLMGNPISQGSVDSTAGLTTLVPAKASAKLAYWMSVGQNLQSVQSLDAYVRENRPEKLLRRAAVYWEGWATKVKHNYGGMSERAIRLFRHSLLTIRTQTDIRGAITAANDSDILQYNRDHYSYVWPRDGAMIALAVSDAGYPELVEPFFVFCAEGLSPEGYLHHKYNPDGTVGSSWHPYLSEGAPQLPIQIDETGLVLHAFWKLYEQHGDIAFAQSLYKPLVVRAAKFLASYLDPETGLPSPCYDLWEERHGIYTYSVSAVHAGLMAASNFCRLFGNEERANRFLEVADNVKAAILKHLWDEEEGRFIRGLYRSGGAWVKDMTLESSIYGIAAFGVLPTTDPRVDKTMRAISEGLLVRTHVGGIARYYNDYYFQRTGNLNEAPGNPWIICTLWVADWKIESATSLEELEAASKTIEWVADHALKTGMLPEQLDPFSGSPLSVTPLTWSHATYVATCMKYINKYKELTSTSSRPQQETSMVGKG
ncbi:oligosaccharide amylase [Paenibacillus phyllosphaerae]|uniref:Oligosaccharide amylase n=1 Tax=Paenibacillus phyllosphaerae TaxID=274593 RepID=A0A7W5ATP3_9BACL|nr:glycoside hydrolase family 15 protein [Paenibacillus phyllosphaerae]MBB3108585.1 oligosaccharide amylase [Paenibacillus phyllosphaerae]